MNGTLSRSTRICLYLQECSKRINRYMKPKLLIPATMLTETSLDTLYTNTIRGFDTPRKQTAGRVQMVKKIFIAAPRAKAVGVRATTRSDSKQYDTRMFFRGVEYIEDGDEGNSGYTFQTSDGQEFTVTPISYTNDDVEVTCTCLDFHYRFSVWNHSDGSLFGSAPAPYIKTTDRAPQNPNKIPGLCKHLISLTDTLRQEQFLK